MCPQCGHVLLFKKLTYQCVCFVPYPYPCFLAMNQTTPNKFISCSYLVLSISNFYESSKYFKSQYWIIVKSFL